jgi:protein SCO1/2
LGKVVVVFFGFTQCPDVCPTALAELAEVKKHAGQGRRQAAGHLRHGGPRARHAEMLKAYMANFDPSFLALIPTPSS